MQACFVDVEQGENHAGHSGGGVQTCRRYPGIFLSFFGALGQSALI